MCRMPNARTYPLASLGDRDSPVERDDVHARRCHALQQGARLVDVDDHRDFGVDCLDLVDHHALGGVHNKSIGSNCDKSRKAMAAPHHEATDRLSNHLMVLWHVCTCVLQYKLNGLLADDGMIHRSKHLNHVL